LSFTPPRARAPAHAAPARRVITTAHPAAPRCHSALSLPAPYTKTQTRASIHPRPRITPASAKRLIMRHALYAATASTSFSTQRPWSLMS
jgi:hypothetical protein